MNHYASSKFWALYDALPREVREVADKNYELLRTNPRHPSLHFKRIGNLWSVRAGIHHIQYRDYGPEWNEWVALKRIRPII